MTEAHSARDHAKLSPSAASRWIACPGSVLMASHVAEDRSSAAANEGTAAHELAAWVLSDGSRVPGDMLGRVIDINADVDAKRFLAKGSPTDGMTRWPVTDEMVEAVETFVDHVRGLVGKDGCAELHVETRLDISHVHPDIWGTGDVLVFDEDTKHLHVIDLKYGRGVVVEAEENPQLALYGAGAAQRYHNRGVKTVTLTIIQPRAPHPKGPIRSETIAHAELTGRARKIGSAAAMVDEARDKVSAMEHGEWLAAYVFPGDHCRFCPVGATCPRRAEQAMLDAQAEFSDSGEMTLPNPEKMTPAELGDMLTKARRIQHWINAVEERANAEALAGNVPDGFKLVEKRATRKWTDEQAVIDLAPVMLSVDEKAIFAEPKLLSPAQLEKLLPKDERAHLAPFITKSSSGVNLVPIEDARPGVRPSAEEEFEAT